MTTYLRPGVFIEETLSPLSDLSTNPSASAAAFVGVSTGGGPVGPTLVTSWNQYQALYGGIGTVDDDLSYAVFTFFSNGGSGCYIVRALNPDSVPADLSVNGTQAVPEAVLDIKASAGGVWSSDPTSGSRVFITIQPSGLPGATRFDLIVESGTGGFLAAREQFTDLSMDPTDPRNVIEIVNSPVVGSKYVTVTSLVASGTDYTDTLNPDAVSKAPLTGGSDGTGTPDLFVATQRLDTVDRDLVVNVPNADATSIVEIVNWAVAGGRHFIVADVPKPVPGETAQDSVTSQTSYTDTLPNVSQVAVYGPWQYMVDPGSKAGAMRLTAPGGAVVGQYLATDASRGVFKAPAGVQTVVAGSVAPYENFTNQQQDDLATAGVNLIKVVPGAGICIMGARTQGIGFPDRYVSVRRLLISIKSDLARITRFALFENNNIDLWATVQDTVDRYLQTLFDLGAFKGTAATQSFYVVCDETNNTDVSAAAGSLNIEVGVALSSPAEFIIIRLGQTTAGATVTDSLDA